MLWLVNTNLQRLFSLVLENTKMATLLGLETPIAPSKGDTLIEEQIQISIGFSKMAFTSLLLLAFPSTSTQ